MGKKDKNKKKGKGAEKTAQKTEKKQSNKLKKELQARGEDDIENIVAEIEKEEQSRLQVVEKLVDPPSRRLNFTFVAHPDKDEIILFGGEYFNGQKTFMYNDLYFYNIPHNTWTLVKAPGGPPPRCGHQMAVASANKGQLWVFGGEYASSTQSQFYHYRDLWLYHIEKKQWEKISAPNGPSARSGHRMVYVKKQLILFGGFHDNLRDCKYFNDVYLFNTDTYQWSKIEASGIPPSPRSGCCMVPLTDGKILIYGGYSKEKIKKDVDKGHVYNDAFLLGPDKNDTTGTKWKWSQVKLGGVHFQPRCSMPMTLAPNQTAYAFGGVFDEEEDEDISGNFFNDFYALDLQKLVWRNQILSGKKDDLKTKRRKAKTDSATDEGGNEADMEVEELKEAVETTTLADDGTFKVTLGPKTNTPVANLGEAGEESALFQPHPRISCGLAVKHGVLYLYGGMFEDGDKQVTFSDLYSLDLKKMDEWRTIIADDTSTQEWLESSSEGEQEKDSESSESDEEDSAMETD